MTSRISFSEGLGKSYMRFPILFDFITEKNLRQKKV